MKLGRLQRYFESKAILHKEEIEQKPHLQQRGVHMHSSILSVSHEAIARHHISYKKKHQSVKYFLDRTIGDVQRSLS